MNYFVYIDFSLTDDGRAVGFATGRMEFRVQPTVGQYLRIGAAIDAVENERAKSEFLITRVVPADRNVPGNEELSWLITCDDNFFSTRREVQQTVAYLERHGFVFDEFNRS